jgi:hypothetical protein
MGKISKKTDAPGQRRSVPEMMLGIAGKLYEREFRSLDNLRSYLGDKPGLYRIPEKMAGDVTRLGGIVCTNAFQVFEFCMTGRVSGFGPLQPPIGGPSMFEVVASAFGVRFATPTAERLPRTATCTTCRTGSDCFDTRGWWSAPSLRTSSRLTSPTPVNGDRIVCWTSLLLINCRGLAPEISAAVWHNCRLALVASCVQNSLDSENWLIRRAMPFPSGFPRTTTVGHRGQSSRDACNGRSAPPLRTPSLLIPFTSRREPSLLRRSNMRGVFTALHPNVTFRFLSRK